MSGEFDPYHKWLGILPKDQPPHHYRLLGLERFEDDLEVIERAADRQLSFLRKYQSGEHSADCMKLLNQVSRARLCLLKPDTKAAYDADLRSKLARTTSGDHSEDDDSETSPANGNLLLPAIGGGVLAVIVVVAFLFLRGGGNAKPQPADQPPPPREVAQTPKDTNVGPGAADQNPPADANHVTPGQTDLLPLLGAKDVLKGQWKTEPKLLESLGSELQGQIALPMDVPVEYTLHVDAKRIDTPKAPSDVFAVGLVCGRYGCMHAISGGTSGLQMLNGREWTDNETTSPNISLPVGQAFQYDAIVRQNNVEIRLNGRTIVDWHGDFSCLQRKFDWNAAAANRLFVGAETGFQITKLTLGPPLPRIKVPGSDVKPGEHIELVKLVKLDRDARLGKWQQDGQGVRSDPNSDGARISIPVDLPAEYRLIAQVEFLGEKREIYLGLPCQRGYAAMVLGDGANHESGLMLDYDTVYVEGVAAHATPHLVSPSPPLNLGLNEIVAEVRKDHLVVKVNGTSVFDWQGDTRRLAKPTVWATPGQYVAVGASRSDFLLRSLSVTPLSESPGLYPQPVAPQDGDLLAMTDVGRDTAQAAWSRADKKITSSERGCSAIRFPTALPANYEFRMVVQRQAGLSSLAFALPVSGKSVMTAIDNGNGSTSGVEWIEDKRSPDNSIRVLQSAHRLPMGKPCVILGRVEGRHLHVDVNGEKLVDIDVPEGLNDPVWEFRPAWLSADERLHIRVATWFTVFDVLDARFRPLDGNAPPLPPLDPAWLNAVPSSPGKAAPTANADTEREVFSSDALDLAKAKVLPDFTAKLAAAKGIEEKKRLALSLERLASETPIDPALNYAYLDLELSIWTSLAEFDMALPVVDRMIALRWRDPSDALALQLVSVTLRNISVRASSPDLNKQLVQRLFPIVEQYLYADNYSGAVSLTERFADQAARMNDRALQAEFAALRNAAQTLEREKLAAKKAESRLESSPNDAGARLILGRWKCLRRDDWDAGLELLASSNNQPLKELATRDKQARANPNTTNTDSFKLATDWLEFAKSRKDRSLSGFADRALYWLDKAGTHLTAASDKQQMESQTLEALKVRDSDLPTADLLAKLQKEVKSDAINRLELTGPMTGAAFEDISPLARVLIGVDFAVVKNSNPQADGALSIQSLRPIYATRLGTKRGEWHGTPPQAGAERTVLAPNGFAVSGIAVQNGPGLSAIQLRFARITKLGLDRRRTIISPVYPQARPNLSLSPVTPSSEPIIGIFGHADDAIHSLGVIVAK